MIAFEDDCEVGVISLEKYIEIIRNCWLSIKFDIETIDQYCKNSFNMNSLVEMCK